MKPITCLLLTGSSEGRKERNLIAAMMLLANELEMVEMSGIYESPAWGFEHSENFLNQCLQVTTSMSPKELMTYIKEVEKEVGRETKIEEGYSSRIIDIDILFYGSQIVTDDDLTIPHKHIAKRRFALLPLSEINPDFIHPILQKSVRQLLEECEDPSVVKIYRHVRSSVPSC